MTEQNRRQREERDIQAGTDALLAMTVAEHLHAAARTIATPVSSHEWADQYLHALVHLGMAQVKQAARAT